MNEILRSNIKLKMPYHLIWLACIVLVSFLQRIALIELLRRLISYSESRDTEHVGTILILMVVATAVVMFLRFIKECIQFQSYQDLLCATEDRIIEVNLDKAGQPGKAADKIVSEMRQTIDQAADRIWKNNANWVEAIALTVFLTVYTAFLNYELVIWCYVISFVFLIFAMRQSKSIMPNSKAFGEAINQIHTVMWDYVRNSIVASFLDREKVFDALNTSVQDTKKAQIDFNRSNNVVRILGRFASIIVTILLFLYVMLGWDSMILSDFVVLVITLPMLAEAMFQTPGLLSERNAISSLMEIADRMLRDEDEKPKSVTCPDKLILIRDLIYSYNSNDESVKPILNIGHVEIPVGRPLFLIGPNGSGKSTLMKLWTAPCQVDK